MKTTHSLHTLLRGFFEDHWVGQRDISPNTILAYRDAFLLFLRFAAKRSNCQVIRLQLEDLGPATLQAFLNHCSSTPEASASHVMESTTLFNDTPSQQPKPNPR
jgi:site-specific recombinase XerD